MLNLPRSFLLKAPDHHQTLLRCSIALYKYVYCKNAKQNVFPGLDTFTYILFFSIKFVDPDPEWMDPNSSEQMDLDPGTLPQKI